MFALLIKLAAPLISLFVFALSNGFLSTLLAVRLHEAGYGSVVVGLLSAVYYAGLVIGAFRTERLTHRIGHIRAFAAFSSAIAVVTLLHGMWINAWFWMLLRLIGGAATAGLFVVIESWLLTISVSANRGRVLAIYMVMIYLGQAIGQLFLNTGNIDALFPFAINAMLASLAVIPLAIANSDCPRFEAISSLRFRQLYVLSPSGSIGCLCAGLLLGAIYGLLPLYLMQNLNENQHSLLAWLMAAAIFGGMSLQYPVGRFSDTIERRKVLIAICLLIVICCILLILTHLSPILIGLLLFLLGGGAFAVYPISISHACDSIETHDITAAIQGLLIFYSVGAVLGPLLGSILMHYSDAIGLPLFLGGVSILLGGFFLWRKANTPRAIQEEPFIPMAQTTPMLAEIDPRGEEDI